jgi:hypothetical protein
MTLLNFKNWTQRFAVLADLNEASPKRADKRKETEAGIYCR